MFTGSVGVNRMSVGLSPIIRQALYDDAKDLGIKPPEYLRHVLTEWYDRWREPRGRLPK